jgi:hypothetical protein
MIDADVLFAAAASSSEHGASLLILRLAELTLVQAFASRQVVVEAERNLQDKIPKVVGLFDTLVGRTCEIVPDPDPDTINRYAGLAHPKDLAILVAALENQCSWLLTFNVKDYQPGHPSVTVIRPGDFILLVRQQLTQLLGSKHRN